MICWVCGEYMVCDPDLPGNARKLTAEEQLELSRDADAARLQEGWAQFKLARTAKN